MTQDRTSGNTAAWYLALEPRRASLIPGAASATRRVWSRIAASKAGRRRTASSRSNGLLTRSRTKASKPGEAGR